MPKSTWPYFSSSLVGLVTMLPPQPVFQVAALLGSEPQPPSIWNADGSRNGLAPLKVRLRSLLMS
jgi:hypothetical protein